MAKHPLVDEHPPMKRARGSAIDRPSPSGSDRYPQSWPSVGCDASTRSAGRSSTIIASGPPSTSSTSQLGFSLNRAASTQPADPPPTTRKSTIWPPSHESVLPSLPRVSGRSQRSRLVHLCVNVRVCSLGLLLLAVGEAVEDGVDDVAEVEGFVFAAAGAGAGVTLHADGAVDVLDAAAAEIGDDGG